METLIEYSADANSLRKIMNMKRLFIGITLFSLTACASRTQTPTLAPTPTRTAPAIPSPIPTPTFAFGKFGAVELDVIYCTPNNVPQQMDIYYPASGGPWPVLLYVHGGGWSKGDKAEGVGWRSMTERGFLVVSVNYRLASDTIKFPAMIEDVKCTVRYLRAHAHEYNLDSNHIGAVGVSAGGHLVDLLGLTDESAGWDTGEYADQSSRVQAVVTMAGISDLTFTRGTYASADSAAMMVYYAFDEMPGSASPKLVAASPIAYITPDDPPFLIIHGEQDQVVPVEQSQVLDERLRQGSVSSQFVVVRNGTHGIYAENISPTVEEISNLITTFLEEHLK
jgi:acetyl esterase/lipase